MGKKTKWIGADELMAELDADPEWVAQRDAREKAKLEKEQMLAIEAEPLIHDLYIAGFNVESEWDFFKMPDDSYIEAIPVLTKHLERDYHHRIYEGIIRALTVPAARGEPARVMLRVFRHSDNQRAYIRESMVNALAMIADNSMVDELEELLANERVGNIKIFLEQVIAKAKKRKSVS